MEGLGQPPSGRLFAHPVELVAVADNDELDVLAVLEQVRRANHRLEILGCADIAGEHHLEPLGQNGEAGFVYGRRVLAQVFPLRKPSDFPLFARHAADRALESLRGRENHIAAGIDPAREPARHLVGEW